MSRDVNSLLADWDAMISDPRSEYAVVIDRQLLMRWRSLVAAIAPPEPCDSERSDPRPRRR